MYVIKLYVTMIIGLNIEETIKNYHEGWKPYDTKLNTANFSGMELYSQKICKELIITEHNKSFNPDKLLEYIIAFNGITTAHVEYATVLYNGTESFGAVDIDGRYHIEDYEEEH